MSDRHILVTTASGKTGFAVATQLRDQGARVRALVTRMDSRAEQLQRLGAEIVVGNLFDTRDMRRALDGVDAVYAATPFHPHALDASVVLAEAAMHVGVTDVVQLSQWLASPDNPSLATRHMWLTERLFAELPGVNHVVVQPGYFADNYLAMTGVASQTGLFLMPTGTPRNAPPSNEDIARVAVGALLDTSKHAGRRYRPTGPRLLSGDDMAEAIGVAVGRKVRHVDVPIWLYLRALRVSGRRVAGMDMFTMLGAYSYTLESRAGTWEIGAPTTHVKDVSGQDPEEFVDIARRYAARPMFARTPGNLLLGMVDALRIAVTPAPDLEKFARRQQHPRLSDTSLASHSEFWAREHVPQPAKA
jgi:uncharacterized protein YbjT (DUF2867 family)